MFGGSGNKTFGFGATPATTNVFGSTGTGFGSFGVKPTTGLFGNTATPASSSMFGAQPTGLFGNTPTTGLFGATTTPQQVSSTGSTSLFGSQPATNNFLKPAATNTFGNSGAFGTAAPAAVGLFGSTQPVAQAGMFGGAQSGTATSGLFGASTTFGATHVSTVSNVTGTAQIKFTPTDGTDNMIKSGISTTVKTKHYCITGMKQYEAKSLEELRLDDYAAGVKGPKPGGGGVTATTGLFGGASTQPAASGFPLFGGAPVSSAAPFGFGSTNTQTATAFGTKPAGSLFGGGSTTTGGLFGQTSAPTVGTGFGSVTTSNATGGIFGNTAAKPNPFGAPNGFAQPAAFGNNNASSAFTFGNKPTSGFGATTNVSAGFGFGGQVAAAPGFSFGVKPATAFGSQQPTVGSGFGGFNSLGQTNTTTVAPSSLFGGCTASGFNAGGAGVFGSIGTTTQPQQQPVQLASNTDLQTQQIQQIYNLANSPYGDSPLFRNIKKDSKSKRDLIPTDPATQKALLTSSGSKLKVSTRPAAKVKLTNLTSVQAIGTSSTVKGDLFEGLEDDSYSSPGKFGARRSVKKLVIRSSPAVGASSSRISTAEQHQSAFSSPSLYARDPPTRVGSDLTTPGDETFNLSAVGRDAAARGSVAKIYPTLELDDTMDQFQNGRVSAHNPKPSPRDTKPPLDVTYTSDSNSTPVTSPDTSSSNRGFQKATVLQPVNDNRMDMYDVKNRLNVSKQEHVEASMDDGGEQVCEPHPCGIICTRPDYYTLPPLEELEDYQDTNGDCLVDNLTIGREGYGSVFFPGTTNVANLDIDAIVHFRRKEITIYPDDDNKPTEGEGLNKRAEVTLDCVWPTDKSTRSPIKSPGRLKTMNYQDKIEQATSRIGAKFIDYRPGTGSWVFEVRHFSKYGLLDDDSDDDNAATAGQTAGDVEKLKVLQVQSTNVQKQPIYEADKSMQQRLAAGDTLATAPREGVPSRLPTSRSGTNCLGMEESDEEERENRDPLHNPQLNLTMLRSSGTNISKDVDVEGTAPDHMPTSHMLAVQCGAETTSVQRMKASFFDDDDDDNEMYGYQRRPLSQRHLQGSPSMSTRSLMKQTSGALSPFPQSPLIRSGVKGISSPAHDKLHTSLYKTEVKLTSEELKWENYEHFEDKKSLLLNASRLSSEIQIPEPDYPLLPSGMERKLRPKTRIQGQRLQLSNISFERSLVYDKRRCLIDGGCIAGRRSRVGWGPSLKVAHNTGSGRSVFSSAGDKRRSSRRHAGSNFSILSPARGARLTSEYQVTIETANVGAQSTKSDPLVQETRVKALRIQLKNSTAVQSGNDAAMCPRLEPNPGIVALHEYGKESLNDLDAAVSGQSDRDTQTMFRHIVLIWELMVALWGSLPEFEHIEDLDENSYLYKNSRNEAFSRWLSYAANFKVEQETSVNNKQASGFPATIFSHLTARQIPEATKLAIKSKDLRLALLLSQAATNQNTRSMIHKQLSDWNHTMADQFIPADRLKLYVLLAGNMIWENSSGLINCCMDLDWKRALALHYWYSQSKFNIQTALAHYDAAWKDDVDCETYAAPPVPLYMEESGEDDSQTKDACYHLLKLYCNSSYGLEKLLSSASNTSDPLDYHTSWHLMQVLRALDYTHLGDWESSALHIRYAEQLESCGLWEWAILPLLNLTCHHLERGKAIKELLIRHVRINVTLGSSSSSGSCDSSAEDSGSASEGETESEDEDYLRREKFLLTELNIPSLWLNEAKAVRARFDGLYEEEAWHLLMSRQLNSAHKIVLEQLAPELIVRDDLDGLHSYLDILQQGCDSVSEWIVGGKVYLDYITIHDIVSDLHQQQESKTGTDGYSLEKLSHEVLSLGRRLLSLHTPTPMHRLAQANMSLNTAQNIKYIMSLDKERVLAVSNAAPEEDIVFARYVVEPLSFLPLQSDDSVCFLRETMSAFMLEY